MNILLLNWRDVRNPKSGGAEIVTLEHAKAWVKAGNTVAWFTSTFRGGKNEEIIDGVRIIRRGNSITTLLYAPFYYFRKRQDYDVVIDEIHGLPYFTPLYVRKPTIAFIHEVADEIWDYMFPFPLNKIGKFIESLYFHVYKNIIFWTDAPSTIDELVSNGIPRSQCVAIPCPITKSSKTNDFPKEKVPTFIFVSRLVKMKGIEEVIRSFSYILESLPNAKLWIVGDGEAAYVQKLKDYVESNDLQRSVTFFGRVDEKKKFELLRKAHILLHASVKEGWGLVVLEAASEGTPAVVYNVHGLKDVVDHGKTGWVVKKNTPEELSSQALRLMGDSARYSSYQKNAIKRAESFTWSDVTYQSLKLIKSL